VQSKPQRALKPVSAGKWWRAVTPLVVAGLITVIPPPAGLRVQAWYHFALFAAVIVALILEPLPGAMLGLIGITAAASLRLVETSPADAIRWALSGFSDPAVWLIFLSFLFVLGYEKSGLGRRIALTLVKHLGKRTLGLGYAVTLADLTIAPVMPSNTGRSAGTIFPIVRSIPELYGSFPGESARKIGAYLMWTAFAAQCVTSSMFLTALGPNLLAVSLINATAKVNITWMEWFVGFAPVGVLLILLLPLIVYWVYPPTLKRSDDVPVWASRELAEMGSFTRNEVKMSVLALVALALWIFAADWLNPATVALIVVCLMVLSGLIDWNDVLAYKQAWNVLCWFATLVTLADGLRRAGFLKWFAESSAARISGLPPLAVTVLIVAAFYLVHYMFASLTAHVTALLPVFVAAAMQVQGVHIKELCLLLCYTVGIMGILTPYATGPSPVYYGCGYISRKAFWALGLLFGALYLVVFLVIGIPYLRALTP
jgi:L-tartrate/succinate antiporter